MKALSSAVICRSQVTITRDIDQMNTIARDRRAKCFEPAHRLVKGRSKFCLVYHPNNDVTMSSMCSGVPWAGDMCGQGGRWFVRRRLCQHHFLQHAACHHVTRQCHRARGHRLHVHVDSC